MELINALEWRYATKKMNGNAVAQDKVDRIVEAARLAPTSNGLQPVRVFVITDPELKAKIQPIAYGQSQIVDASHVLVFTAWDAYTDARFDEIFNHANAERGLPAGSNEDYKNSLKAQFGTLPLEQQQAHAAKQAYLSFGVAIAAAAMEQVDATPMEGFVNEQLDELLGLKDLGLKSTTILALGERDTNNDWLVNLKKVRVAKDEFATIK